MDQCTRRIVGFGVQRDVVDGVGLCRMFNRVTRGHTPPTYVSSDHDPLYRFHQWEANLRILDVKAIKTVPYVPLSHPFVERLIGTIRRECLDRVLFWTTADLEIKLLDFQHYYNGHRTHGPGGTYTRTPRGRERRTSESLRVPMAAALSWTVSNADRGVTRVTCRERQVQSWLVLGGRTLSCAPTVALGGIRTRFELRQCMFVQARLHIRNSPGTRSRYMVSARRCREVSQNAERLVEISRKHVLSGDDDEDEVRRCCSHESVEVSLRVMGISAIAFLHGLRGFRDGSPDAPCPANSSSFVRCAFS